MEQGQAQSFIAHPVENKSYLTYLCYKTIILSIAYHFESIVRNNGKTFNKCHFWSISNKKRLVSRGYPRKIVIFFRDAGISIPAGQVDLTERFETNHSRHTNPENFRQ